MALSTVLFVAFGGTGLGAHKIISNNGEEVILVDLKDRFQNEAVLTDIDGKHFVIVTLNGPNQPDKHTDARKLYNYAKEKLSKAKNKSR